VAINAALWLEASHGNGIVTNLQCQIYPLLLPSFHPAIFILSLHLSSHKNANFETFILKS